MNDIYLRELTPEDGPLLRDMRMRAVVMHPEFFFDTVERVAGYEPSYWRQRLAKQGNKFFCLFQGERCIGLSSVVGWRKDETGQTGMNCSTFIEPEFRGRGLVNLFYAARLRHALVYRPWRRLVTDHREGNEASRKAIMRHGFLFTEKEEIDWPNGDRAYEYRYELNLEKLREAQP